MSTGERPTILLIMGSVRAGRRCPQIAEWVCSLADRSGKLACEIVHLTEWHLPFGDEPGIPAKGAYMQDHTRAWSAKVAGAEGFVIVSPQCTCSIDLLEAASAY
jgi:NAD(P)H-dependent FMN reductase